MLTNKKTINTIVKEDSKLDVINLYTINALRESLGLSVTESLDQLSHLDIDTWISYQHSLPNTSAPKQLIEAYYNSLMSLYKMQQVLEGEIKLKSKNAIPVFDDLNVFSEQFPGAKLLSFRIYNAAAMHVYLQDMGEFNITLKKYEHGDTELVETIPNFEHFSVKCAAPPVVVN